MVTILIFTLKHKQRWRILWWRATGTQLLACLVFQESDLLNFDLAALGNLSRIVVDLIGQMATNGGVADGNVWT